MIYTCTGEDRWQDDFDFVGLESVVRRTCKDLRAWGVEKFTSVVTRGMSGVAVGSPVALRLHKPLVVVRKPDDQSHHSRTSHQQGPAVIGFEDVGDAPLFVDDFYCTGSTRVAVAKALEPRYSLVAEYYYHYTTGELRLATDES